MDYINIYLISTLWFIRAEKKCGLKHNIQCARYAIFSEIDKGKNETVTNEGWIDMVGTHWKAK